MIAIDVRRLYREIESFLPIKIRNKIRSFNPAREILRKIEDLQSPRHVALRDGTEWTRVDDCPMSLLDPGGAQIGNLMYVIAGFQDGGAVNDFVHVYDMEQLRWLKPIPIPDDMPHSHCGVSTDSERFIYIVAGQVGPQCRPAVATAYCLDTRHSSWHRLPSLPAARYAGTMQLAKGRLHYVGGADADRWTPRSDHWSLGISGSGATDVDWTVEKPIPVPGMHRGSAIVDGAIYVIGGQQGDFQAIPNDAKYTCTGRTQETYLASVFRLSPDDGTWLRMSDLPIAASHCDFSCMVIDKTIYVYGGQVFKHPESFQLRLTNAIQAYDTTADSWAISGYLPYHLKMPVLGHHGGKVFISVGQRGKETTDTPGIISPRTWVSLAPEARRKAEKIHLPSVSGKRVLLVSHELSRSGAPLELLELGQAMIENNAQVRLVTLNGDMKHDNLSADFKIPLVAPETALARAREADLIVVNTAAHVVSDWVAASLELSPELAERFLWLIHEIDVEELAHCAPVLRKAKVATFDSSASLKAWDEIGGLPNVAKVVPPGLPAAIFAGAAQPKQAFANSSQWLLGEQSKLLTRDEVRSALGIRKDEIVILSVGSVCARKGQELLLAATAQAASERKLPLKLLLAGFNSDDQRKAFLDGLDADGRKVFNARLAYTTTPYIDALFLASDLHVLNSQGERGRGETFGRATVHAMAYGLPVLGTNVGGTPEIFEDGVHGYQYPVGVEGQGVLIDRIAALSSSPELRQQMGIAASAYARAHFMKERYLSDMDKVIGLTCPPEAPSV